MNPTTWTLYGDTRSHRDASAAAALTLADALMTARDARSFPSESEPQSAHRQRSSSRLKLCRKKVYQMCQAGELRSIRAAEPSASRPRRSSVSETETRVAPSFLANRPSALLAAARLILVERKHRCDGHGEGMPGIRYGSQTRANRLFRLKSRRIIGLPRG